MQFWVWTKVTESARMGSTLSSVLRMETCGEESLGKGSGIVFSKVFAEIIAHTPILGEN